MNIFLLEDDILLKDGISHYLKLIGHSVWSGNINSYSELKDSEIK